MNDEEPETGLVPRKKYSNQEIHDRLKAILDRMFCFERGVAKESYIRIEKDDWYALESLRLRLERTLQGDGSR